jgi:hypothetical protein
MLIALAAIVFLLLYQLGSLVGGVSAGEVLASQMPVGWHGIFQQPLYLPLELARSVVFALFADHGQTLTRLPNTLFGFLAIISFVWLIKLWHGRRTALFAGFLFATSAWVLHASRLASFDVLYLCAVPILLVSYVKMQRDNGKAYVFYGSLMVWGAMLYIPGMVWLLLVNLYVSRKAIIGGWRHFSRWWQRLLYLLIGIGWLPLLIYRLRHVIELKLWLGLPLQLEPPLVLLKHFVAVFVHLFIRGPQYPEMWLGRAPILDIFTLIACVIGIYFYARHFTATRSRLLGVFFFIGIILVALGGPVGLSLLVPILYILAATGIAYLMREWLQTFPRNPLARGVGLTLIILAVALSCTYNLRAYFVAWPNNSATKTVFRYHL